jgi:hypothetical protein
VDCFAKVSDPDCKCSFFPAKRRDVNTRRGPWLSGLIIALLGAVWLIGRVLGGVVGLVAGTLSVPPM